MQNEKMREEFEVWRLNVFCGGEQRLKKCTNAPDVYYYTEIQAAWQAWQASRESLVIELPQKDPAGSGGGDCGDGRPSEEQYVAAHCNIVLAQCRAAIEAAGLKVKP